MSLVITGDANRQMSCCSVCCTWGRAIACMFEGIKGQVSCLKRMDPPINKFSGFLNYPTIGIILNGQRINYWKHSINLWTCVILHCLYKANFMSNWETPRFMLHDWNSNLWDCLEAWRPFLTALQNSLHLVSKIKASQASKLISAMYWWNGSELVLQNFSKYSNKQTGVVYLQVFRNITMNNCLLLTVLIRRPCSTGCSHQAE